MQTPTTKNARSATRLVIRLPRAKESPRGRSTVSLQETTRFRQANVAARRGKDKSRGARRRPDLMFELFARMDYTRGLLASRGVPRNPLSSHGRIAIPTAQGYLL